MSRTISRNEATKRLRAFFLEGRQGSINQIGASLGVRAHTLHPHLRKMRAAGEIDEAPDREPGVRGPGAPIYRPTGKLLGGSARTTTERAIAALPDLWWVWHPHRVGQPRQGAT